MNVLVRNLEPCGWHRLLLSQFGAVSLELIAVPGLSNWQKAIFWQKKT